MVLGGKDIYRFDHVRLDAVEHHSLATDEPPLQ
jgi:hypothetical protein